MNTFHTKYLLAGDFWMKWMETIRKCMGWSWRRVPETHITTTAAHSIGNRDLRVEDLGSHMTLQEGMSAGTARFIIERFYGPEQMPQCEIRDIENRGRYFRVRMAEPGSRVSRELLVDKQCGHIIYCQIVSNP